MSKASEYAERVAAANQSVPPSFKTGGFCELFVDGGGGLVALGSDQFKVTPDRVPALIAWLRENYED